MKKKKKTVKQFPAINPQNVDAGQLAENVEDLKVVPPALWFESKACFDHWVQRGIAVLEELGIALDPGVRPSSADVSPYASPPKEEGSRR